MERTDVLVIGGSAAGIVAATTGKSYYPNKDFFLIRKEKRVIVPCGIPYIFGSLESSEQNMVPDTVLSNAGVRLKIDEVVFVDQENKVCKTADDTEISFEKLVLATVLLRWFPNGLRGRIWITYLPYPKIKNTLIKSRQS